MILRSLHINLRFRTRLALVMFVTMTCTGAILTWNYVISFSSAAAPGQPPGGRSPRSNAIATTASISPSTPFPTPAAIRPSESSFPPVRRPGWSALSIRPITGWAKLKAGFAPLSGFIAEAIQLMWAVKPELRHLDKAVFGQIAQELKLAPRVSQSAAAALARVTSTDWAFG